MLNRYLSESDFYLLSADVQQAFRPGWEIVTIPNNTLLYKLTEYGAVDERKPFAPQSPWWSVVQPFKGIKHQDTYGAAGRLEEAELNNLTLLDMVRFASCVKFNWNKLSNYVEIELLDSARAFWGQFSPMEKIDKEVPFVFQAHHQSWPTLLGGLDEVFQLYIPNLHAFRRVNKPIGLTATPLREVAGYREVISISATDHKAIWQHLKKKNATRVTRSI